MVNGYKKGGPGDAAGRAHRGVAMLLVAAVIAGGRAMPPGVVTVDVPAIMQEKHDGHEGYDHGGVSSKIRRSSCGKRTLVWLWRWLHFCRQWLGRMKRLSRRSARRVATNSVKRSASRSLRLPARGACRTRCRERMPCARTVEERKAAPSRAPCPDAGACEKGRVDPAGYADDAGPGHGRRCRDGAWRWHGARSSVVAEGAAHGGTLHAVPWPVLRRGGAQAARSCESSRGCRSRRSKCTTGRQWCLKTASPRGGRKPFREGAKGLSGWTAQTRPQFLLQ